MSDVFIREHSLSDAGCFYAELMRRFDFLSRVLNRILLLFLRLTTFRVNKVRFTFGSGLFLE
jgi:hypothetical protein